MQSPRIRNNTVSSVDPPTILRLRVLRWESVRLSHPRDLRRKIVMMSSKDTSTHQISGMKSFASRY